MFKLGFAGLGTTSSFLSVPSYLLTLGRVGWGGEVEKITRQINKEKPFHSLTYGNMQATSSKLMLRAQISGSSETKLLHSRTVNWQSSSPLSLKVQKVES